MGSWLSQPYKTSPGKYVHFLPIYLPHLHRGIRAVLDFALLRKLVRPTYAFYVISVRQARDLPRTSFRFHLTMDTLVSG